MRGSIIFNNEYFGKYFFAKRFIAAWRLVDKECRTAGVAGIEGTVGLHVLRPEFKWPMPPDFARQRKNRHPNRLSVGVLKPGGRIAFPFRRKKGSGPGLAQESPDRLAVPQSPLRRRRIYLEELSCQNA